MVTVADLLSIYYVLGTLYICIVSFPLIGARFSPWDRWDLQFTEMKYLSKTTQLVRTWAGIPAQVCLPPKAGFFPPVCTSFAGRHSSSVPCLLLSSLSCYWSPGCLPSISRSLTKFRDRCLKYDWSGQTSSKHRKGKPVSLEACVRSQEQKLYQFLLYFLFLVSIISVASLNRARKQPQRGNMNSSGIDLFPAELWEESREEPKDLEKSVQMKLVFL